ncbi:MAG: hypothetical protein A2096_16280 [Spirochaetes bacterium GWF1_41_5]|nr:MAG: hypothetical protein A2096_16280 [Spirochaetes bacterium GWF1_41_5]
MKYLGISISALLRYRIHSLLACLKYNMFFVWPGQKQLKTTALLRNSARGKSAFVFANGPSLARLNPEKIARLQKQGYDIFAINSYLRSSFFKIAAPDYFLISDPAYFGDYRYLSKEQLAGNGMQEALADLAELKKYPEIRLLIPIRYYSKIKHENIICFNDSEYLWGSNVNDLTRVRGYSSMTAYKSLAAACHLGYDKIYICGFDNNYFKHLFVNKKNEMFYRDEHFYDLDNPLIWKVHSYEGLSVGQLLWSHHFKFTDLEKFKNEPVINLDPDSLVDAFPKEHTLDVYQ